MGKTLVGLSERKLEEKPIFDKRFVIEVAELFHVHYRNLRIVLSQADWEAFGRGCADAWQRWVQRGKPECAHGTHIELCRKDVASSPVSDELCAVNLNKNLYALHEGKIFAEGAGLEDQTYIHLKMRDLRIEMTEKEFLIFADVVRKAEAQLLGPCGDYPKEKRVDGYEV